MPNPTKIQHALHNEEVCNFLCPKHTYADWVLITAFYSAIHYVDHKIFPLKSKDNAGNSFKIKCIDEYRNNNTPGLDKHTHRVQLVSKLCPQISNAFRWLKDSGHKSRYNNYVFARPADMITAAKERLKEIKDFCEK